MVPILCAFTNIVTLKSSFHENRLVCYEYRNEKDGKVWCITYLDGETLCNLEFWCEQYVKQYNAQNMSNFWPQYVKQFVLSCIFISLLYSSIYFHSFLFHYVAPVRNMCSESPIEAAWNPSAEGTIISDSVIDISTAISYLKRIIQTFVTLSTCVSARLSVVSFLSSCAVWGTDRVTLDVRLDLEI